MTVIDFEKAKGVQPVKHDNEEVIEKEIYFLYYVYGRKMNADMVDLGAVSAFINLRVESEIFGEKLNVVNFARLEKDLLKMCQTKFPQTCNVVIINVIPLGLVTEDNNTRVYREEIERTDDD